MTDFEKSITNKINNMMRFYGCGLFQIVHGENGIRLTNRVEIPLQYGSEDVNALFKQYENRPNSLLVNLAKTLKGSISYDEEKSNQIGNYWEGDGCKSKRSAFTIKTKKNTFTIYKNVFVSLPEGVFITLDFYFN